MKNFKRKLRFALLILMIVIATIGVGLTGVAPLSSFKRLSKLSESFKTEMQDEEEDDESSVKKGEIKS